MSSIRRYAALFALVGVSALVVTACTDTPAPSSKGNRAVGVEEEEIAEAKPPPEVEKGIVPDLAGVSVADAETALGDAGLELGELKTRGLFGTVSDDMVICEQTPSPGIKPPKKEQQVDLVADRQC